MKIKSIKSKREYAACLDWVDREFDKKVAHNTTMGNKLQEVLSLIKKYEDKHYPIINERYITGLRSPRSGFHQFPSYT